VALYHRLQRFEEVTGASLKDGAQRTALHLEIKIARLTGEFVPRYAAHPAVPTVRR